MKLFLSTIITLFFTLQTSAQIIPSSFAAPITAAAFTPDGAAVILGSQSGLTLNAFPSLKQVKSIPTKLPSINAIQFSPDHKTLAVAGGFPAEGGMIELYAWPSAKLLHRADIHKDLVYAIAWAPDSSQYATASADGLCHIFNASDNAKSQTFDGHSGPVLGITFTHDGKSIVSGGKDQTLRLWYADSGSLRRSLHNHTNTVRDLAFQPPHPDHPRPYLASAGADKTVRFWQPEIGRMVRFAKIPSPALAIAWRPSGDILLVSTQDGAIYTIDPDTVEVTQPFKPFESYAYTLAMHPTGDQIIAGGRNGQALAFKIDLNQTNPLPPSSATQPHLPVSPTPNQMKSQMMKNHPSEKMPSKMQP